MPIVVHKSQLKAAQPQAAPPPPKTPEEEATARRFSKVVMNKPLRRGEYFGLDDPSSRYEITEILGEGGTGRVVRAIDKILEMEVAIKILAPRLVRDASSLADLKREVRITLSLVHPHILRIYNLEKSGFNYMIIMELLKGNPLSRLLSQAQGVFEPDFSIQVVQVAASALGYAHRHGVLHLDINPANIFLTDDGVVKVIDFGIAKLAGGGPSKSDYVVGTPEYMSPEQARGDMLDARSDVYSLGVVAAQLLTGHTLHASGVAVATVATTPHPPVQGVTQEVAAVLECATAFNKEDRFADVEEFANALAAAAATRQDA